LTESPHEEVKVVPNSRPTDSEKVENDKLNVMPFRR